MQNPFTDKIAAGDQFCDRDQERAELSRLARGGHSAVLLSPRRYGKSSLALETLTDMRGQGLLTAYVDVMPVSSERELVERLARGVAQGFGWGMALGQLPRQLGRLFAHVHLEFSLDATGPSVSAMLDPTPKCFNCWRKCWNRHADTLNRRGVEHVSFWTSFRRSRNWRNLASSRPACARSSSDTRASPGCTLAVEGTSCGPCLPTATGPFLTAHQLSSCTNSPRRPWFHGSLRHLPRRARYAVRRQLDSSTATAEDMPTMFSGLPRRHGT